MSAGRRRLEARLRAGLRDLDAPGEAAAAARSRRLVAAAFAERAPARPRRARHARRLAAAAGAAALVLVAALTPAGATVGDWIEERVGLAPERAEPTLAGFPPGGRLLAVGESGAWIVEGGGDLRRLGDFRWVDWSPHGLFVAGTSGRRVTAVEPDGEARWSILRPRPVSRPAWSPGDGFRVAYLERGAAGGFDLRVADGSGNLDHRVPGQVAAVTPAWRPGPGYTLSAAAAGRPRVVTRDADSGALRWAAPTDRPPVALEWTRGGDRLAVLLPGALRILDRRGRPLAEHGLPAEARPRALALRPDGARAAIALERRGVSRVVTLPLRAGAGGRAVRFTGSGSFAELDWSPDGRRLLVGWPDANQWLLLGPGRPRAFAGVSRELDPGGRGAGFPRPAGWCC